MKTIDHPNVYIQTLPEDCKQAIIKLRQILTNNLPDGFMEQMAYGMITYVVPHTLYPPGYHCNPKQALPFISIASQKQHIAIYHMGLYANTKLYHWFISEYSKHSAQKPDLGKSCIRFKKTEHIPYNLIAALCKKMSVSDWIKCYETQFHKTTKKAGKS